MIIQHMLAIAGFAGRKGRRRPAAPSVNHIPAQCAECVGRSGTTLAETEGDPVYQKALCSEQRRAGCYPVHAPANPYHYMVPDFPSWR